MCIVCTKVGCVFVFKFCLKQTSALLVMEHMTCKEKLQFFVCGSFLERHCAVAFSPLVRRSVAHNNRNTKRDNKSSNVTTDLKKKTTNSHYSLHNALVQKSLSVAVFCGFFCRTWP